MFEFTYFTDYEPNLETRILVSALVGDIGVSLASHKYAWSTMLAGQLKHAGYKTVDINRQGKLNWEDYDVILLDHGMEFKGSFNLFGGIDDKMYYATNRIFTKGVRVYSYAHEMPDIGAFIRGRAKATNELFKTLQPKVDEATEICKEIKKVDQITKTNRLILGDSHSFSLYRPGYMTSRHDGLTMHGALSRGLSTYMFPWVDDLIVYFGNIDIRHHLMRQNDPLVAINKLVEDYEEQLKGLGVSKIIVSEVLPIENESRKLPKTGFYKGTPFFGSWAERDALHRYMNIKINEMCNRNGWSVYHIPQCFYNEKGELTFDVMEKPQSVHISREFHYWNYELDTENEKVK